ncbi:FAD-dependent oxidoreductase [Aspergillus undulatus]|uniref:FAD-dependent oxidoreductase n=1 Tax=Aspergillus undulatus TaxID=1810928 RepID=UPI003CCDDA21
MPSVAATQSLDVAIVGSGLTSLVLAIELLSRGFKLESGIAFTPNTEWAMRVIDPRIYVAFKKVATRDARYWVSWVNAYGDDQIAPIHKMHIEKGGLVELVLANCIVFGKYLETIQGRGDDKKLALKFKDKTMAEADVAKHYCQMFGCDGIHSRVRQLVLGKDDPASHQSYTHKYALRGLVPWHKAKTILRDEVASSRYVQIGNCAHVADGQCFNVVAFVHDPNEWPDGNLKAFRNFVSVTKAITNLLPGKLDRWTVFHTYDNPATTHVKGRLCLAHESSPHHGAEAGMGVEDAAALVSLLELAQEGLQDKRYKKASLI